MSPNTTLPPDVATMRKAVDLLLDPDAAVPDNEHLAALTTRLRGHLFLMIHVVEGLALQVPAADIPRWCALAAVGEAQTRVRVEPGWGPPDGYPAHARRLARALNALCDHYDALTGVRTCVLCDKPIEDLAKSLPYRQLTGEAGASARVHDTCV
ncbi:DUF6415 family natural product biosynthesis protein [Streptomyces sp. NPDC090306]|uniref:DUF6415 family natural product biosynthesis protein n=1 Tax=Streptomyces sp. NPDC090306 TaxID=3365961 RepID=UPI003807764F